MKLILPDVLPEGWALTRLDSVLQNHSGNSKLIKGKQFDAPGEGRFPGFSASGQDVWLSHYEEEGPAIIISAVGARCGKCFFADGKWSAVANTNVVKFDTEAISHRFLWYLVNDEDFWVKSGSGQPFVKTKASLERTFALPPLPEQHRIVAKIEELFSELDAGTASLTRARAQLKTYRQALLKAAFEGKLTAPWRAAGKPWRQTRLGDEITFLTSGSRGWADHYADEGEIFIRAQNLKHDRLDLTDIAYVKLPTGATEGLRTRVHTGDVLVTITGANVTKTGIVNRDLGAAYVSQHVALCRPGPNLRPEFLYWYLLSETGGRRQLNKAAYGAGKPGLNLENIREVRLSLPCHEEQDKIVAHVSALLSDEENIRQTIQDEQTRITALRQSILKKAFSGKLVPQDPADEPASALLARLAKAPAPKTRRKTKP